MSTQYQITRDKFFEIKQRNRILKSSDEHAELDRMKGRTTWPVRRILVRLAFFTGLRVQEIANLKIKDLNFDFEDPYIFVRRGKGGKSREVYILPELVKALKGFIKEKRSWGQRTDPEAPILSGRGGKHFTSTALTLSFRQAVIKSGLPWVPGRKEKGDQLNLSIHSARHTYASILYARCKNLKYVQRQLGHSSVIMTSLYANVMPEDNGRLIRMMNYE